MRRCRSIGGIRVHVNQEVQVIAHDRPGIDSAGKNVAELQDSFFNPRLSVLEAFVRVFVLAARPGSAHAAVDAVKIERDSVRWLWPGIIRH